MKKLLIASMFFVSAPAFAELEKGACRKMVKEMCGQHKGDRQAMKACMKENKENLPEECRKRGKKWRKHKKDQRQETSES